ncbi:MAG: hypothetical protein RIT10_2108 [Bacteroidota bacterium]
MKKLIIAVSLFAAMFTQKAQAQEYFHGIGAQALIGIYSYDYDYTFFDGSGISSGSESGFSIASVPSIFYKATLGFELPRHSNFAVSAYPSLGFNLNSQTGGSLGYQFPIMAEYYMGDIDDANFNIGLGFSYGYASSTSTAEFGDSYVSPVIGAVVGPTLGLGGQFEMSDRLLGVRGSFTYGINSTPGFTRDTKFLMTIGVYYPFGQ